MHFYLYNLLIVCMQDGDLATTANHVDSHAGVAVK